MVYGCHELRLLFNQYGSFLPTDCQLTDVALSFRQLRRNVQRSPALRQLGHYDLWMNVLSKRHRADYDLGLLTLIEISLVTPVDTAFLERVFAEMNRIQCKSRNRLSPEMLHHLLVMCLLGPSDGLVGVERLMPEIIAKWRSNTKSGRYKVKVSTQALYDGMEHEPMGAWDDVLHPVTNQEFIHLFMEELKTK